MSRCPKCHTEYPEHVIVCANDGEILDDSVRRVGGGQDDTVALEPISGNDDTLALKIGDLAGGPSIGSRAPTTPLTNEPGRRAVAVGATQALRHEPAPDRISQIMVGADDDETLPAGFKVGEYEVTRQIGAGGMASVYAGVQPLIGKEVAIKVLSRMLSSDRGMVERFVQEARAVNQIRHHNIVDIFAMGSLPDGRAYCVMELCIGETLKDRLRRGSPSYEETVSIFSQICEGLDAAHRANVVHRDLKPDNVFLVESPRGAQVKILDFGIAKLIDNESRPTHQTRAGILVGTPEYMSPEQCSGREVDARTDVYLLGVMLYEVFTGRLPFNAKTPIQTLNAHVSERPTDPQEYAEVPDDLRDLILSCLAKEPVDRPQSALEVRDRLVAVIQSLGVDVAHVTAVPAASGTPIVRTGARTRPSGALAQPSSRSMAGAASPSQAIAMGTTPSGQLVAPPKKKSVALIVGGVLVLALAAVGLVVVVNHLKKTDQAPAQPAPPVASAVEPPPTPPVQPPVAVEGPTLAVQVISDPPGATVTLNGQVQTLKSPYVFKIAPTKSLAVKIELAGHTPVEQQIELAPNQLEKVVEVKLVPEDAGKGSATPSNDPKSKPVVKGAPSVISELQLATTTAIVGEKTTITGTIKYSDPDGDLASIRAQASNDRTAQTTPLRVSGTKTGTVAFTAVVKATKAGPLTVEVWVQDAGENESNRLTGMIEVKDKAGAEGSAAAGSASKGSADKGSGQEQGSADEPEGDKPEEEKPEGE